MITVKKLLEKEPIFLNLFGNKKDIEYEFQVKLEENIKILFAYYEDENYSGSAWVLFEKNGELYEASGEHCSCYGLDGQWEPDITCLESLEMRLKEGTFGYFYNSDIVRTELKKFLEIEGENDK